MIRGQSLKQLVESNGIRHTTYQLQELLTMGRNGDKDGLSWRDFSLKDVAEAFLGRDWVDRLNPGTARFQSLDIQEAGDAVDVSAFSNITGQIFFSKVLEGWDLAGMIGDQVAENMPSTLETEKLPFLSRPLTEGEEIHPGMPFPEAGLAEEYITTARTAQFGQILSLHKTAIFFDRTGQMMKRAGELGEQLRMNKERRILNLLVGASSAPAFSWKGVSYLPFQTAGTYWTNSFTGSPLVDQTSVEAVEIAASKILDPDLQNVGINSPINIMLDTIIVMQFKLHTARRIVNAEQIRMVDQAVAPNFITIGKSTLDPYKVITSKILYQQAIATGATATQAQDWWWMVDSAKKPIVYVENWPLHIINAPPNTTAEFERDIVWRGRVDERGNPSWQDPRYIFKMTNT